MTKVYRFDQHEATYNICPQGFSDGDVQPDRDNKHLEVEVY